MSNMSYCRFHNTLLDLRDCYESMKEDEPLSESELIARNKLVELCSRIHNEIDAEGIAESHYICEEDD